MPNDTSTLIAHLTREATRISPLAHPWSRALSWVGFSLLSLAATVLLWPFHAAFPLSFGDAHFALEQTAALLTGVTAAAAAFATTVPGHDRRVLIAPLFPLALWMGTIGEGCVRDLLERGFVGLVVMKHWQCLTATIAVGTVPAIAMAVMLRRGAPLTPHLTTALGGVAAAGIANFGVRFVHQFDASLLVLTWHVGSLVAFSILAGAAGRSLLKWRVSAPAATS